MSIMVAALIVLSAVTSAFGVEIDTPQEILPPGVSKIIGEKETIYFDRVGNKTGMKVFRDDGSLLWEVSYTYNNMGLLEEELALDRQGEQRWRVLYSFDQYGRSTGESHFDHLDRPEYTLVHEYQGERRETFAYNGEGLVLWRQKRETPADRGIRETSYYYPDGTRIKAVIQHLGNWNLVKEEVHIDEIGGVYRRIVTDRNEFGNITNQRVYNAAGEIERQIWLSYLPTGHLGRVRQILPKDQSVTTARYNYRIDSRGAWVRREKVISSSDGHTEDGHITEGKDERRREVEQREVYYYESPPDTPMPKRSESE